MPKNTLKSVCGILIGPERKVKQLQRVDSERIIFVLEGYAPSEQKNLTGGHTPSEQKNLTEGTPPPEQKI